MSRILGIIAAAAILAVATASGAAAQTYPTRTVKFILPFGPASGTDITARLVADRLAARWGKPVVIENRPGGDGLVSINAFISRQRRPHPAVGSGRHLRGASLSSKDKLPYDADRDLLPIANVSSLFLAASTPASLNVGSLRELVELVRANPGKFNWAAANGNADFLMSGFLKSNGLQMAKVPYRDIMQAPNDLAENRIQLLSSSLAIVHAADAGRQDQGAGGDRPQARAERARRADRDRGRLSGAGDGKHRRHFRAARHADRSCGNRSPPTCGRRSRATRRSRPSCKPPDKSSMCAARRSSPPASRNCTNSSRRSPSCSA